MVQKIWALTFRISKPNFNLFSSQNIQKTSRNLYEYTFNPKTFFNQLEI